MAPLTVAILVLAGHPAPGDTYGERGFDPSLIYAVAALDAKTGETVASFETGGIRFMYLG